MCAVIDFKLCAHVCSHGNGIIISYCTKSMSNGLISTLRAERKGAASESSPGQLRRLCLNISRRLNSVVRVLWRPSKLCTWFVFHPRNLLSLDTASSSYLISALWDIKYMLIFKNCLRGWWGEVQRQPSKPFGKKIYWDLAAGCGLSKKF